MVGVVPLLFFFFPLQYRVTSSWRYRNHRYHRNHRCFVGVLGRTLWFMFLTRVVQPFNFFLHSRKVVFANGLVKLRWISLDRRIKQHQNND